MIHLEFTMQRRHLILIVAALFVALVLVPGVSWASNQFTDVPDSNTFHNDIAWLADAGVTKGCNPPANDEFCPGNPVTREQMAAFMHRLADNKVVDAATAVDSDKLDGLDSTEFAPSDLVGTSIMTVSSDQAGNPLGGGLNGPTGLTRVAAGHYVVTFDWDVRSCVTATNDILWASNNDVSADPTAGEANEIVVKVINHDQTAFISMPWSMIVVCPDVALLGDLGATSPNAP